jgi:Zn-dependent M28 family amino/carboxypeptidase
MNRFLSVRTFGFVACLAIGGTLLRAAAPVSTDQLRNDLNILASDEYEGRGIGTKGIDRAAEYISDQFAKAGLNVVAAGGDAFQEFEVLDRSELGDKNSVTIAGPENKRFEATIDRDFVTCSFSGSGAISAPLVFVGYGIESTTPAYNDFDGLEVRGKAVVIIRRTPQQGKSDGLFSDPHGGGGRAAELKTKISNAYRRGAAAVLLLNDGHTGRESAGQLSAALDKAEARVIEAAETLPKENPTAEALKALADAVSHLKQLREQVAGDDADPLIKFGYGGPPQGDAIPVFHIRRTFADELLKAATGKSIAELEHAIDVSGKPASIDLTGWTLEAEGTVRTIMADVKNVIGVLEGRGPHAAETVVVGAHYDHLGFGGEGSLSPASKEIHNGADDNGSGTVAILELARHFGAHPQADRRRLVFIAFTGEERGLLGSAEYVKSPIIPLEGTVAMINLDMVGRLTDDKLTVFGSETSKEWNAWLDTAAAGQKLTLIKKPEGFGPSDHSSFYARQIPVLHLFTGVHSDYHRPGDDIDKINFDGLSRVVAFTERIISDCATASAKPTYVQVAGKAELERTGSRPYFGSIPDFGSSEKGYAIQGVSPGGPADKGGIKAGDVIIRLGDQNIGSLDDFDLALRKFSAGQEAEVVVRRAGQEVSLKVTLGKPRG